LTGLAPRPENRGAKTVRVKDIRCWIVWNCNRFIASFRASAFRIAEQPLRDYVEDSDNPLKIGAILLDGLPIPTKNVHKRN
jgi:hypothetical protein